jgi:hypothetical protein
MEANSKSRPRQALRKLAFFCFVPAATLGALGSMYAFAFGGEPIYVQSFADSPGHHYRASVVETGGKRFIVVERAGWKLSLGRATILETIPPVQLNVQWTGVNDLTVTCHACDREQTLISDMPRWRGITFHYILDWQ